MPRRALCLSALVPIVLALGAGPVYADDLVGVSLDGSDWTDQLRRPLFDPALRWVPGDTETRSFWVRNQGPTAASMQLALRRTGLGPLLSRHDVQIDGRVDGGSWTSLTDDAGRTLADGVLAQGEEVRVDVRVAFAPEATNPSERERLPLRFAVRLTQNDAVDDGPQHLPDTGNGVAGWMVWLGAALVGAGLTLLAAARRREAGDE